MNIQININVRTTLAIRRELQAQADCVTLKKLAEDYTLNRHNVAKWRKRRITEDSSHHSHTIHATLNATQESVVVALREVKRNALHKFSGKCLF
jgi:hypothetical protein